MKSSKIILEFKDILQVTQAVQNFSSVMLKITFLSRIPLRVGAPFGEKSELLEDC